MRAASARACLTLLVLVFSCIPVWGQRAKVRSADDELNDKIKDLVGNLIKAKTEGGSDVQKVRDSVTNLFNLSKQNALFALALAHRSQEDYLKAIEEARVDKQVGGSDANAGSTSLAAKGSVPSILGFAVENGALTRTNSGTTITFRGNPVGIIQAFRKEGFIKSYCDDCPETQFLRKFSFALSFDANRGTRPGTFSGDLQQIASYSVRYDLLNRRDPRNKAYREKWASFIGDEGRALGEALSKLATALEKDNAFQSWLTSAREALIAADIGETEGIVKKELGKLPTVMLPGGVERLILRGRKAVDDYLNNRNQILQDISNGPIVTFEYTGIRQLDAPDLSNFKLIAEGSLYKGKVDLTGNASFTILNSKPSGLNLKKVRDFQFSGQIDVPLGQIQKIGAFVFTMSAKYQRMVDNAMAPTGTTVANTKGDIAIAQLKLTIPAKGTGVKIPISLTIANRTELIKEREVRGNIGITFDLDSIFARLKP